MIDYISTYKKVRNGLIKALIVKAFQKFKDMMEMASKISKWG